MSFERLTSSRVVLGTAALFASALASLAIAASSEAAVGTFERLARSPEDLTAMTVDPGTNVIYAQENQGTGYYSYDPRTNVWTELEEAPINSENNGGAAYLNGKIYTSYTEDEAMLGVYDIATNSWTEIANPLGLGTADIASYGGELYLVDETTFVKYNPATETTTPLAEAPLFNGTYGEDCESQKEGFKPWGGLQPYGGTLYGHEGDGACGFASYDIATNTWTELPPLPEGAVAGSAIDPLTGTYYADGNYGESNFYRYSIAGKAWTTVSMPFTVEDAGMAYVSLPGNLRGVYAIQGEEGENFARYSTPGESELAVTASAPASATVGAGAVYTFAIKNNGPDAALNTIVTDAVPSNGALSEASASQGGCSASTAFPSKAATVTCDLGTLASGASATVAVTLTAGTPGTVTNAASAASEYLDLTPANNTASASTAFAAPVVPAPVLTIASLAKAAKGGKVAVKLSCGGGATCGGVVTLTAKVKAKKGKKKLTIGSATYSVASGATKTVRVKLSAKARKALKHGKLAVSATATVTGGATATRAVTLKTTAKKSKKPKKSRK